MQIVYFRQLAQYNAWANWRVYEACAQLSDAERKAPRPCFFGSIHRTLNHILVGDRLWLSRLTASESGVTSVDQELSSDFAVLRAARVRGMNA
ncbi:MAG: DinB family protein [Dongiales bacterium]